MELTGETRFQSTDDKRHLTEKYQGTLARFSQFGLTRLLSTSHPVRWIGLSVRPTHALSPHRGPLTDRDFQRQCFGIHTGNAKITGN